jgi:WD40 repeat protein
VFKSDLHGAAVHDIVAQLTARGTGSGDGGSGDHDGSGAAVSSGGGVAVGVSVAASGMGGVGKTVLALQVFKHADVVCAFGRRRYWLTLGESPDVLSLVNDLLSDLSVDLNGSGVPLGDAVTSVSSLGEASEALDGLLRLMTAGGGGRVLLVLDDVWRADHARPFLLHLHATLGEHWRRVCAVSYVLTSRQSALLSRQLGVVVHELGVVSGDAALDLFWRCCGVDVGDAGRRSHDAAARHICSRVCGGVALALQMVGGVVRYRLGIGLALAEVFQWVVDELGSCAALTADVIDGAGVDEVLGPQPTYRTMNDCVLLTLSTVEIALRQRYRQMAVVGEDVVVSSDVLAVLWSVSAAVARASCLELRDRHLVMPVDSPEPESAAGAVFVMLHDLQRDVLVHEAENVGMSAMHGSLLWSLAKRCCSESDMTTCGGLSSVDWRSLVRRGVSNDDVSDVSDVVVYARLHLSYHLGAMCDDMMFFNCSLVEIDGSLSVSLSDARHALVHGVALNFGWLVGRCVCGGGSVAGADGDVAVAERVVQRELSCSDGSTSTVVGDVASLKSTLRVLGWVRRALELCGLAIRRDVGRCASYLWASLEPVMRCCDDDGARRLLGDVVCALDVCRRSACIAAGGGWLAVSSAGEMSAASALVRSLPGHKSQVTCVAVGCMDSSGRRCLVSGSWDGTLRVWDVEAFECLHELKAHGIAVTCVSDVFVGGDGRHMVASGSRDESVRVWDVGSGTCVRVLEGHSGCVYGLSSMFVDTAGRLCVASASQDRGIRVWDVDVGACVSVMTGHDGEVNCVSVVGTVDGRQLLASGSDDGTVWLWDATSLECVRVMRGHSGIVTCVSGGISMGDSDRVLVVSGSHDEHLRLWDVRTGDCVCMLSGHRDTVTSVGSRIDVDGRRLVTSGSQDGSMRLWDVASGECVGAVSVPGVRVGAVSDGFGVGVGVSVDRLLVSTGCGDGVVRVWDVRSVLRSQSSRVGDGGVIVSCVSNGFVDRISGRCLVASGCDDGSVALWDVDSGECVRVMTGHTGYVMCISSAFIASGRQLLASGSWDMTVQLWDVGSGECFRVLAAHDGCVRSVSSGFVDATGRMLIASSTAHSAVRLWDVDSGECVRVLSDHSDVVKCVSECFSDIGSGRRFIASGSDDFTVRVWDVDTGACVRVLSGHNDSVTSVSVGIVDSTGRQLLASASVDSSVGLWDAVSGQCVRVLLENLHQVLCVTGGFVDSRGRHCIASTARNATLPVSDVSTGATASVVMLSEETGFSCPRDAQCASIISSGDTASGRCRLAVVAGGRLVIVEHC